MENKLVDNLKKYMYELAEAKYTNMYSSACYANKINLYQTACNVMLDQCNALDIELGDLTVSYCGYDVSVDDLYSFEEQCSFYK